MIPGTGHPAPASFEPGKAGTGIRYGRHPAGDVWQPAVPCRAFPGKTCRSLISPLLLAAIQATVSHFEQSLARWL